MVNSDFVPYSSGTRLDNLIVTGLREGVNLVDGLWWMIWNGGLEPAADTDTIEDDTAVVEGVIIACDCIIFKAIFRSIVIQTVLFLPTPVELFEASNIIDSSKLSMELLSAKRTML